MNNFNRLLLLYIDLFLIEKYHMIIEFKNRFDDFNIGILSEKIKGKWNPIYSIIK